MSSERALSFIASLKARRADAFAWALALDETDRRALGDALGAWLDGSHAFHEADATHLLSFVADAAWPDLVARACAHLRASDEEAQARAMSVLDGASLEMPSALLPALPSLAELSRPRNVARRLERWRRTATLPRLPTLHLVVPLELVEPYRRHPHPTRDAPEGAPRLRFGGLAEARCGLCHEPLHHLLTLEPAEVPHLGLAQRLEITTCTSCLGWEQHPDPWLSYRHDARGVATPLDRLEAPIVPQFPRGPLRELTLPIFDAGPRFAVQDWGYSNGVQNLHRIGGAASWVQDFEPVSCPVCASPMRFLMQLDSDLPDLQDGHFDWASGSGVMYAQLCDACAVTSLLWQTT